MSIAAMLRGGMSDAQAMASFAGLPIERVYRRLVRLEGRGLVRVYVYLGARVWERA
jgi:sugar-specific transcriptional regulator TrmB